MKRGVVLAHNGPIDGFSRPALLRRPGHAGRARPDSPDSAREEAGRPFPVVDVPREDPVQVGAAGADPAELRACSGAEGPTWTRGRPTTGRASGWRSSGQP